MSGIFLLFFSSLSIGDRYADWREHCPSSIQAKSPEAGAPVVPLEPEVAFVLRAASNFWLGFAPSLEGLVWCLGVLEGSPRCATFGPGLEGQARRHCVWLKPLLLSWSSGLTQSSPSFHVPGRTVVLPVHLLIVCTSTPVPSAATLLPSSGRARA